MVKPSDSSDSDLIEIHAVERFLQILAAVFGYNYTDLWYQPINKVIETLKVLEARLKEVLPDFNPEGWPEHSKKSYQGYLMTFYLQIGEWYDNQPMSPTFEESIFLDNISRNLGLHQPNVPGCNETVFCLLMVEWLLIERLPGFEEYLKAEDEIYLRGMEGLFQKGLLSAEDKEALLQSLAEPQKMTEAVKWVRWWYNEREKLQRSANISSSRENRRN